ncbi:MAG: beta-lactamase family protein [Treponema sp.]|jgi:CubicO group peptidase (beta-lactamase class C family)|nr:beta-lactamase family protein [Treponema sp.]
MGVTVLESASAEEAGLNRAVLDDLFRALERSSAELRGLVLVRRGKAVARRFWPPYGEQDPVWVYSLSKSFCSTAVGFALREGLLRVDEPVLSFFPEYEAAAGENCRAMRVQDLLTMRTGHDVDTTPAMLRAPDWGESFFRQPVKHPPGTYFVYNSGASYMLSALVQKRCGLPIIEYLRPRLFEPLGFGPVFWDSSPQGVNTGGWGFMAALEDIAKFGLLYLNRGIWRGSRILDESWVDEASLPHADNSITGSGGDWGRGYGYQFWRSRYGFRGDGAFGQYCLVLPEFDAVLVLSSETENMQELLDIVWAHLPAAFSTAEPEREKEIGGREFNLAENGGGFRSALLNFFPDRLSLTLKGGGEAPHLEAGRFGWLESETRFPLEGYSFIPLFAPAGEAKKVSAFFLWRDRETLELRLVYRTSPHREFITVKIQGNSLGIQYAPNAAVRSIGRPALEFRGLLA